MDPVQPEASVAQTGKGIRYIGTHAYCLSGTYGAATSDQIVLSFTSGSGYIDAEFTVNQFVKPDDPDDFDLTLALISFNGSQVANMLVGTAQAEGWNRTPSQGFQKLIIPPFTEVLVTLRGHSTDSDDLGTVTMTGRVYGVE